MGRLRQSTEKIQELLDMVENNEVGGKVTVDSSLSTTSENPVQNKVVTEELGKKVNKTDMATINGKSLTEGGNIVIEGGGTSATPDWNASEGEAGYIKGRSHRINGASPIPFEWWSKRFDEDGNAIYFQTLPPDNYSGCLIREGILQEENYIFFGTEWKSLSPAVSAEIRINYDYDSGDSVLEIKLDRYGDPEGTIVNVINNALFAYGFSEDFIYPIANEFIPDTIARTNEVDELREETTALWENLDHGTFPNLVAGDLAGRGESVPASFGFRASGGKSIKDGRAYIKRIKGNSVVWNNMADTRGYEGEFVIRGVATIIAGHKYLLMREKADGYLYLNPVVDGAEKYDMVLQPGEYAKIFAAQYTDTSNAIIFGTVAMGGCVISDLTKMFQAGNEPSTIEEFNARVATLGIDMYAYNEGQVIHMNTESIKSVGDNAWDEQWRQGYYENGEFIAYEAFVANENLLQVIPNETYYYSAPEGVTMSICYYDNEETYIGEGSVLSNTTFTIPANVSYINFRFDSNYGSTYNHDILISLYHSGWKAQKDDQYQPYWQDILPLPIIKKYFPDGMKLAGAAHDEIRFNKTSGKWEYSKGRIKSVDLGTLTWESAEYEGHSAFHSKNNSLGAKYADGIFYLCAKYQSAEHRIQTEGLDKSIALNNGYYAPQGVRDHITIRDTAYTDVESFKASLQGVMLYYESNDWEWVELDAEDQNFRDYYQVADFGTEMSQSEVPSAAFSADIIYQFNAVDMIREHEAEINELQSIIATMQAQLTSLTHNT